ncbi:TetR/AcrR family transcriptional regulator [Amnibacterium sp. CER49]|uniref:TetR/AcrR family transcriptional regulator n=1 Tax=Amnibacterium sp. CER49 TaxID=3039161 RepID=UPI002448495D|nr:TetR/AcrR family transcriptional regulator [Amnibacterium sp. CER49]MDH2443715.1 TetR/AcrR family transcriptional regulator [Amnibacterium sp. CER49]
MTADRPRAPRRDATENREALLEAARRILNEDPEASLDAIAAGAGLSRRAVYGHFPSRNTLVAELAERGAARVAAAIERATAEDPALDVALLGRVVWDEVEHVRAMTSTIVHGPLRERIGAALGPIHGRLVADARRAGEQGGRTDLSPETVARLIEGAAFTVLDESLRSPLSRRDGRRLVVLAGLGALGLSWREAGELLDRNAALLMEDR